ncbi:MAG TPA: polysaccharide deacetylase family protein, partial [Clostridia bacterium]|nr:polysaccharide deacetylase family protein [Clostridia bacterium]
FFIGNRLDRFPSFVKRAYNEGNLVLCHGWDHTDLIKLSADQIKKQIESSQNKFSQLIGKKPLIIHPPYGDVNGKVLSAAADENCKLVIWSIDTLDWSQKEPSHIIKNVIDNVRPGEIILMHSNEDKKATAEALPGIIKGLQEKGYEFVTVAEMLGVDAYK